MAEKKLYTVAWVVDVYADTAEEAAREAQKLRDERDYDRIDNQFYVASEYDPLLRSCLDSLRSIDLDVIDDRI